MEPHASSVTMATPINSFERKRSHDPHNGSTDQPNPPKRLCPSPRKSGCVNDHVISLYIIIYPYRTPHKHNATPPIRSCDLAHMSSEEPGSSNQGDVQLPGDIVDMELLESVINDSQLPQQLANSINAALQRLVSVALMSSAVLIVSCSHCVLLTALASVCPMSCNAVAPVCVMSYCGPRHVIL